MDALTTGLPPSVLGVKANPMASLVSGEPRAPRRTAASCLEMQRRFPTLLRIVAGKSAVDLEDRRPQRCWPPLPLALPDSVPAPEMV